MSKINDLKNLRDANNISKKHNNTEEEDEMDSVNGIINNNDNINDNQSILGNINSISGNQLWNKSDKSVTIKEAIPDDGRQQKQQASRIAISAWDELKQKEALLMTEVPQTFDSKDLFSFHDWIVPAGKNAKLCLINDPFNKNIRVTEIADHFSFYEPTSVIVLIGANTNKKVKLMAGLSRSALNCRAVIIDSGIQTGIERFCWRKNITLIGVAPESQIEYPKINPEEFSKTLLTNGHSHFILWGKNDKTLQWGQEAKFKINLAERWIHGRKGGYPYVSKCVGVILGNIPSCIDEILMFIERKWPLIWIEDSDLSHNIKEVRYGNEDDAMTYGEKVNTIAKYSKLLEIDDDSENWAASIHWCLTLSF